MENLRDLRVAILVDDGFEEVESLKTDLRNAGAEWVDQEVVVSDNLVTSRKPDDIPAFNQSMIDLFSRASTPTGHAA